MKYFWRSLPLSLSKTFPLYYTYSYIFSLQPFFPCRFFLFSRKFLATFQPLSSSNCSLRIQKITLYSPHIRFALRPNFFLSLRPNSFFFLCFSFHKIFFFFFNLIASICLLLCYLENSIIYIYIYFKWPTCQTTRTLHAVHNLTQCYITRLYIFVVASSYLAWPSRTLLVVPLLFFFIFFFLYRTIWCCFIASICLLSRFIS